MILFFALFLAYIGTTEEVPKTPRPGNISADYYIPQALSSFSYVIEQKKWRGDNPLQLIKKYYTEKKVPAFVATADFKAGIRQGGTSFQVGDNLSHSWLLEARKLTAETLAKIDPKNPEAGAEGTLEANRCCNSCCCSYCQWCRFCRSRC
jgi:hypothetical protein